MSSCGLCVKSISAKQLKLSCNDCSREFHATCLKMSRTDVECITADEMVWRCNDCAATRRKSMRFESEASDGKLTLEDVMKVVTEIRDSQKSYERSFNETFVSLDSQLTENTNALKAQQEQNKKLYELIDSLTAENKQLKKTVKVLEERVEEMEQYSRNNCVEIQGIPLSPREDVLSIIKDIGRALDMPISDTMVDACHRLGGKQVGENPPGIIVKFVRRIDKEEFLKKKRVKKTLSTRHIGRADDKPIYVNESLSPARRKLHAMARIFKKENGYKFLWVRNGKIFLRKKEDDPVKVIKCQEDLR